MDLGGGSGSSMNPAGMMTGMMMGGAMGNQMANMMNQMGSSMNPGSNQGGPPPPPQQKLYYIAVDGEKTGPFNKSQLTQLKQNNLFSNNSIVWTEGMSDWSEASNILDLKDILNTKIPTSGPPPPPPSKK